MKPKRKQVSETIEDIDYESVSLESTKPRCFNQKMDYCKKELCKDWFDTCLPEEPN